jgi:hypothetical protein
MQIRAVLFACLLPTIALAQQPLSVIDWLSAIPPGSSFGPVLPEPPVTDTAQRPDIDVSPLEVRAAPMGLVPPEVTGLPVDLWRGSDAAVLAWLISRAPVGSSPAMQTLLYTLLLAETIPPRGDGPAETLLLARVDRLLALGATDPAQALIAHAGPTATAARFARWFDATLLTGDEDLSCAALNAAPHLSPGYGARIFCLARGGDWLTAALTLEAVHALDILAPDRRALLDRFLSPGVFENAPPLPIPDDPDPLAFRMLEAIGERLPTASLPRAFATADLRDVAGWKAQLEAGERLARIGALGPNRLLGLYSARLPAASGGIWDRVAALQRFETALNTGSPDAVAKTLPGVWTAMRAVGLEVTFAALFADRLAAQPLRDPAAKALAWRIRLLSAGYEAAAWTRPDESENSPDANKFNAFLAALAAGAPQQAPAPNATARAIAQGFDPATRLPTALQLGLDDGRLGAVILRTMALFDSGARGNPADLSSAIATFRAIGLEDTVRRASLQLLLLERV